jgi:hypothetical protein
MTNLSKSSLEQLLSFYEARIEALERELHLAKLNETNAVLDAQINTMNWINNKLNYNG